LKRGLVGQENIIAIVGMDAFSIFPKLEKNSLKRISLLTL
jgi:hypothetical protein